MSHVANAVPDSSGPDSTGPDSLGITRDAIVRGARIGAAALIGFGVMLFIASHWLDMDRRMRFGLVGAVVVAAGLMAMLSARWRTPAALVTTMAIGGLLALVGITYQTGGDPWQLFALWAALTLPIALAARHDAVWCAWTLVASTALALWVHELVGWGPRGRYNVVVIAQWGMLASLAAVLSPWGRFERRIGSSRWAFKLSAILVFVAITKDAVASLYGDGVVFLAGVVVIGALLAVLIYARPFDFSLLAGAALAADVVLIAALWRFAFRSFSSADIFGFLLLGIISAGIVIGSVRILLDVGGRAGGVTSASTDLKPGLAQWPAVLLSAVGALMASVPFLFVFGIFFGPVLSTGPVSIVVGAGTLAVGAVLAAGGSAYGFRQIFALIALLTGGCVIGYGLSVSTTLGTAFALGAVIAIGLAYIIPAVWIAALLGFVAAICVVAAIAIIPQANIFRALQHPPIVALMATTLAGLALLVTVQGPRPIHWLSATHVDKGTAFGLGWVTAMLLATCAAAGPTFLLGATVSTRAVSSLTVGAQLFELTPARCLALVLVVASVGYAFARAMVRPTPTAVALALSAIVLAYLSPPFAIALIVGCVMSALGNRSTGVLAAVVGVWCIGALYYWLGVPFEYKALILTALGLLLGLVTLFDGRVSTGEGMPRGHIVDRASLASKLMVAGALVATGASVMASIVKHEAILREGRIVYVALAPVDPRSLMQGDFMALRFTMPTVPADLLGRARLQAAAILDGRGVATLRRIADHPVTLSGDEVTIDLTAKGTWTVATDAFFFREGQAKIFEAARFGEFRLKQDGSIVLIGLADKDLRPLGR